MAEKKENVLDIIEYQNELKRKDTDINELLKLIKENLQRDPYSKFLKIEYNITVEQRKELLSKGFGVHVSYDFQETKIYYDKCYNSRLKLEKQINEMPKGLYRWILKRVCNIK